jgi:elongator complex protein 3
MRASLNSFDPFLQTKNRLEQLQAIGHNTSKIDLIIMGGTFTSRDPFYQEWFVRRCFDAMNESVSNSLFDAKKVNETAGCRCVGLTVETRPDWFRLRHIDEVLSLGATRVELGVQSVYDDVLYCMRRGHTVIDSVNATRLGKDAGFKIVYHMMPGLPGSDIDRDLECFHSVFEDSDFKPDMIKIYPTLVVKGTPLYDMYKKGEYQPLSTEEASSLIAEVKGFVPEWVRIQRIQRDIPAQHIDQGVDKSNLRQIVEVKMKKKELVCRCIRCREIGHKSLREEVVLDKEDLVLDVCNYEASESDEVFISLVSEKYDALVGFLRLRDINNSHRPELDKKPCMVIRELKVVGRELNIGMRKKSEIQHSGFGRELVAEAERICVEDFDKHNLFVLSGVGVKNYYRNLGFKDNNVYLEKNLK